MNLTRATMTEGDNKSPLVFFAVHDNSLIDTESTYSFLNECFDIALCG